MKRTELYNVAEQLRGLAFGADIDQTIEACAALMQGAVEHGAFAGAEYILLRDAIAHGDIRRAVKWVESNGGKLSIWPFRLTDSKAHDGIWLHANMPALACLIEANVDATSDATTDDETRPGAPECRITLLQAAGLISRGKRALEGYLKKGKIPPPTIRGGKGYASYWRYDDIRPALEKILGRPLPETFPADRFIRR